MSPKHSIDFCPICGGGLCGIRICGLESSDKDPAANHANGKPVSEGDSAGHGAAHRDSAHGLIICDECEAIWLEPDVSSDHQYPCPEDAACPICSRPLWGPNSRWADLADIETIGWASAVNHDLDVNPDQGPNQGIA